MSVIFFLFIISILNNIDGINTQNQAAPQHANNQQAQHKQHVHLFLYTIQNQKKKYPNPSLYTPGIKAR